jgi:hypothetical protein
LAAISASTTSRSMPGAELRNKLPRFPARPANYHENARSSGVPPRDHLQRADSRLNANSNLGITLENPLSL